MWKDSAEGYGWTSILLHWLVAFSFFGLFGLGFWMVELGYYDAWYRTAPHWHKSVGILLAVLMIGRVIWRVSNIKPGPVGNDPKVLVLIAKLTHGVLYVGLFGLFISGYLISTADGRGIEVFDWFSVASLGELIENQEDLAGVIHKYLAYGLLGLVGLHALGAIKHHVINKDETLKRMLRSAK